MINRGGEKISPQEVDEALLEHPWLEEAAAFSIPDRFLGEEIAAAIVVHGEQRIITRDIQEFAAERLAPFKVPRKIFIVQRLPRGATGKVQRAELAAWFGLERPQATCVAPYAPVQEPLQMHLLAIWCEVLVVNQIGMDDNFFDIGGDSLLAARIISRVADAMDQQLSVIDFFEHPTIRAMGARLEAQRTQPPTRALPSMRPVTREQALALSSSQLRMWFASQLDPDATASVRPMAITIIGQLNVDALSSSLQEVVRRHEVLRTIYPSLQGEPRQHIDDAASLSLPVTDLAAYPMAEGGAMARKLAQESAQQHFDLEHGPVLRASLLRLDAMQHILLIAVHHIAFDGWSESVLRTELCAIYAAICSAKPPRLPELDIQYADFAAWQRQRLEDGSFDQQLAYWVNELAAPPALGLPTDYTRPGTMTYAGAINRDVLTGELRDELRLLARRSQCTLFMALLSAFAVVVQARAGQNDIIIGCPISGRTSVQTEPLIGFFVNTLALRIDFSGDPSYLQLLSRVREKAIAAYECQDAPFEKIVEQLRVKRDPSRLPVFQVAFQLRNLPTAQANVAGVEFSTFEFDPGVAHTDLALDITETENELRCACEYNTDLFKPGTIDTLLRDLKTVLSVVVMRPSTRVSQLLVNSDVLPGKR